MSDEHNNEAVAQERHNELMGALARVCCAVEKLVETAGHQAKATERVADRLDGFSVDDGSDCINVMT